LTDAVAADHSIQWREWAEIDETRIAVEATCLSCGQTIFGPVPKRASAVEVTSIMSTMFRMMTFECEPDGSAQDFDTNDPITIDRWELDEEAGANPELFGNFVVEFPISMTYGLAEPVDEAQAVIRAFPGVQRAEHDDREQVRVWGRGVDHARLVEVLEEWRQRGAPKSH
jgi:hypothetical protein